MSENKSQNTPSKAEKPAQAPAAEAGPEDAQAPVEVPTGGVKLARGEETVTAYKPATVTNLKSQGWKVAE